jgi:uncharacterized protein (DUF433 family)
MQTRYITTNPEILGGKPIFIHTRLSVSLIISHLANGWDINMLLQEFPTLKKEHIYEALSLSSHLVANDHIIYA